ncbi:hypothetical protein ALC56_02585 [Trachymyrmex septentrionalis]|uniref:Uncharacterized protein n=1 Tax=Trachymyrmex septentrionalis TaxID=34720 RepID=A0A195FQN8_9HYME|nr:hypothetical protein ALC56_02585 [Trachymyrmex septentrionalis]
MMFNFDPAIPREFYDPGPPAQTGVSGGPLKRILISGCCYLNAQ